MMTKKTVLMFRSVLSIVRFFTLLRIFPLVGVFDSPADSPDGSGSSQNRSCFQGPFLMLCAFAVFGALGAGCGIPPYVTSLDDIIEQEGGNNQVRHRYRCTAGAHRGASEEFTENTIAALKAADENNKYAFIEFDVRYSKDRRIVVYHDKTLFRLYGSIRSIGDTTFEELSKITCGEITAYDEVIGILRKKLNIEIKSGGDREEDQRLVDELMIDIRNRGRAEDVLISSISSDLIQYVRRHYPDISTGQVIWLTSSTYLHFDALTKKLYEDVSATQADYLMLHMANLRNIDDLLRFKPKGKTIVLWDFDDTMYIVHKDMSDRLWGESSLRTFWRFVRYKILSAFRRPKSEMEPGSQRKV
jgi:glycerophosphoryl diester phosphodiesterase